METSFQIKDLDELPSVVQALKELLLDQEHEGASRYHIVLFYGSMGAGKTTLIKELCLQMNVTDTVTSPTFALINEYNTDAGEAVYHFDFYRINSLEEAFDLGYEEYFYSGNLCLIEWPEKVESLLPMQDENGIRTAIVRIENVSEEARKITFQG